MSTYDPRYRSRTEKAYLLVTACQCLWLLARSRNIIKDSHTFTMSLHLSPRPLDTSSSEHPHGIILTGYIVPDASYHFRVAWSGKILEVELQVVLLNKLIFNAKILDSLFRLQHIFMRLRVATNAKRFRLLKRSGNNSITAYC